MNDKNKKIFELKVESCFAFWNASMENAVSAVCRLLPEASGKSTGGTMSEVRRPDLHERLSSQLLAAVQRQEAKAYSQAMAGEDRGELIVCLGSGRCLDPIRGSDSRICPLCLRVPQGYGQQERVPEIVHRFVEGN